MILHKRAVHLVHEVSQRLIRAEYIAVPQKPLHPPKLAANFLLRHQAVIGEE
jgi:hypothetical protein